MSTDPNENKRAESLLKMQSTYWLKRLDHTLTHTQSSSRLIYLIDAAVLALLYFAVQTFEPLERVVFVSAFPAFLLAILNLLHARLITIQHSWYSGIDAKLRDLLKVEAVDHEKRRCFLSSTHGVYRAIHLFIALFLAIAGVVMVLYGRGYLPEIKVTPKAEGKRLIDALQATPYELAGSSVLAGALAQPRAPVRAGVTGDA